MACISVEPVLSRVAPSPAKAGNVDAHNINVLKDIRFIIRLLPSPSLATGRRPRAATPFLLNLHPAAGLRIVIVTQVFAECNPLFA